MQRPRDLHVQDGADPFDVRGPVCLCVRRGAVGVRVSCKGGLGPSHETPNVSLGSWDSLVAVGSQRRFWSKSTVGSEL